MSVKPTNIPKCHLRQSADSAGNFSRHGKLGEVIENIRTFALPFESKPYTFKMSFEYDSWNRVQNMTYPDGERVSYGYNRGGMLENIRGNKNGDLRTYVKDIRYNKFELKESEKYGNGTWMSYEYDSLLRLSHLYSWDGNGDTMQSISYTYDYVGNITDIANSAVTLPNGLGGSYYSHYDYDPLYRLTGAYGDWNNNQLSYNLGMQYYGNGKIWSKQLYADVLDQGNVTVRNYNNRYYYGSSTSNTVTGVYDQTGHVWQSFSWDMAGNMVYHQDANGCGRTLCWDEENRLMSFADCENAGFYQYDAGGERTYKLTSDYVSQNIGGHWHTYQVLDNPTLYTSPYMVATPKGYTKHYYAESERVASRIGGGLDSVDMFIQNFEEFVDKPVVEISPLWTEEYHEEPFDEKRHHNLDHLYHAMDCTGNVPSVVFECLTILYKYSQHPHHEYEPDCYWYHPDHLGSSSWITFSDGKAVQHLHYLPWGENFVDQRSSTFDGARYTFSAKEKDIETGYSYFGSRYYNSDLSIWLSVDPMADKYPSMSPYVYCANNPMRLVDPNGEEIVENLDKWKYNITTGELKWISDKGGKYHQTVVMTCGKGENEKNYQQVDFEGPISKMFDPTVIGPKTDGTINGTLDMVNGATTAFAGAVVAVGSEGAASPIGYPIFVAGAAQMSTGAMEIAYSLNGDNDLYQQHDMMVDICKSAANSASGVIRSFKNNPVKATVKAVGGFVASITWSGIQRRRATHPRYLGIPKGATIKSLP